MQTFGSRRKVWNRSAKKTTGGLTRKDLRKNKHGRIVSVKASKSAKKHNHLKALSFKNNKSGKKEPISYAIEHASYDHLIFTDADCKPNSDLWINKFSNGFKEKEIIIGYGPHIKSKGFLNFLVRLDTAIIGITYLSYALSKFGYMAVGRNMGYTKSIFKFLFGIYKFKANLSLKIVR